MKRADGENFMSRYATELLFYFVNSGNLSAKKICERKIILFEETDKESAYHAALEKGKTEEFSFLDGDDTIEYIFLGVMELISLESEDSDVAWAFYEERLSPLERINKLITEKSKLKAFSSFNKKGKIKLLN